VKEIVAELSPAVAVKDVGALGAIAEITVVTAETTVPLPDVLLPVTTVRINDPVSASTRVYVLAAAPSITSQEVASADVQRSHTYEKVGVGDPPITTCEVRV
jgi:hypothetical protein